MFSFNFVLTSKEMRTLLFITPLFITLLLLVVPGQRAWAQEQQVVVPYTLADRNRAIQTEAKINALDVRF